MRRVAGRALVLLRRLVEELTPHDHALWGLPGVRVSHAFLAGYVALILGVAFREPIIGGATLVVMIAIELGNLPPRNDPDRPVATWRRRLDVRGTWRHPLYLLALTAAAAEHATIFTFIGIVLIGSLIIRIMRSEPLRLYSELRARPIGSLTAGAADLMRARDLERRRDLAELVIHGGIAVAALILALPVTGGVEPRTTIAIAVAAMTAVTAHAALTAFRIRGMRSLMVSHHDAGVVAAFAALDLDAICYLNGHPGSTYAVDVWLRTFEASRHRIGLVYRHVSVEEVDSTELPGVVIPLDPLVEDVVGPSLKVALYPTNGTLNIHLQRDKRLSHVFVGHGDSDKAGSASPFTRSYDQVWVAGPAGRRRYADSGIEIPDDRFVEIGRPVLSPQVREAARLHARSESGQSPLDRLHAELDRLGGGRHLRTILYAPTWEGYFEDSDYSSVRTMAIPLVTTIRAHYPDARIIVKPHPMTGYRVPELLEVIAELERITTTPPTPAPRTAHHPRVDLYEWFDLADLLVTDISSVLTDFLMWDRPIVVTNPQKLDIDVFRTRFPTAAGAHVLDPGSPSAARMFDAAFDHDPMRERRRSVADDLLGGTAIDPLERFDAALDALIAAGPAD